MISEQPFFIMSISTLILWGNYVASWMNTVTFIWFETFYLHWMNEYFHFLRFENSIFVIQLINFVYLHVGNELQNAENSMQIRFKNIPTFSQEHYKFISYSSIYYITRKKLDRPIMLKKFIIKSIFIE